MALAALTVPNQPELYANIRDTFPKTQTLTGNITSNGVFVYGGGLCSFVTEIKTPIGLNLGYIASYSLGEIRKIAQIDSENLLILTEPFSSNLIGEALKWIPAYRFMAVTALEQSGATWKFNRVVLGAGEPKAFSRDMFVEAEILPFFIDTTTNGNRVDVSWQP